MAVLVYIANSEEMLVNKFGFTEKQASLWYTTPYMVAAIFSPLLGLLIDKVGRRALFICLSSVMILVACSLTKSIPDSTDGEMQPLIFIPLIFLGMGYSVYAAALWGSVPYTCEPNQISTAFGLCTSFQNIGMTISPLIAGYILNTDSIYNYFWYLTYFEVIATIGVVLNICLYVDDL